MKTNRRGAYNVRGGNLNTRFSRNNVMRKNNNVGDAREVLKFKYAQKHRNAGRMNRSLGINRSNQNFKNFNTGRFSRFGQNNSNQRKFSRNVMTNTRNQNFVVRRNFQSNMNKFNINSGNFQNITKRISFNNRSVVTDKQVFSNSSGITVVKKVPETSRQFIRSDDELENMTLDDLPGTIPSSLISGGRTSQFMTSSSTLSSRFNLANDSMIADSVSQNSQSRPCVVISNLLPSVSESDILELFGSIGPLIRMQLKGGQALVEFASLDYAQCAVEKFDGVLLDGEAMRCNLLPNYETKLSLASRLGGHSSPAQFSSEQKKSVKFIVKLP